MKMMRQVVLLTPLVLGAAGPAFAEPVAPPFMSAEVQTSASPQTEPSFNSDVERSLADLTQLQCSMLGNVLLNPKPCSMP